MKNINIFLLLTLAMTGFSSFAMDNDLLDAANKQLIEDAEKTAEDGLDLYELIGVSETATQEEIEKARRAKLRENHPDKGGDQAVFRALNNATEILKYAPARLKYNRARRAKVQAAQEARGAQERKQRAAEGAKERAARQAQFDAKVREQTAKAQAEWNQKRNAEKEVREARIRAYREELRRMSPAQAAEKFNFYKLLDVKPNQCGDIGLLGQQLLLKKINTDIYLAWNTAEQIKRDEELNEQLEYAYDTLRFESKRKAYDAALKQKRTRKSGDIEEDTTDRPSKRREKEEAGSSFLGSLAGLFGFK